MLLESASADPSYAAPLFNAGVLAEAEEDWAEASSSFRAFLQRDGNSVWARRAEAELKKIAELEARSDLSETANRRRYDELVEVARRLASAGELAAALAELRVAQELDSSRWEGHILSSSIFTRTQLWSKASGEISAAIQNAPSGKQSELKALYQYVSLYDRAVPTTREEAAVLHASENDLRSKIERGSEVRRSARLAELERRRSPSTWLQKRFSNEASALQDAKDSIGLGRLYLSRGDYVATFRMMLHGSLIVDALIRTGNRMGDLSGIQAGVFADLRRAQQACSSEVAIARSRRSSVQVCPNPSAWRDY